MPVGRGRPATQDAEPKSLHIMWDLVRRPGSGGESQIAMPKTKSEAPAQGDAWGWGQR